MLTNLYAASAALLAVERQGGNGAIIFFGQMMLIFLIFYWLVIRPQRREQQRLQERINAIQKGDEIVTAGGIVGTVVHVSDDRLTIRSEDSRLAIDRGRVANILSTPEGQ